MDGQTLPIDPGEFDEQGYLRLYPDVAVAIARNDEVSGWNHYVQFGFAEGRKANDFDAQFYLAAYPMAAHEIAGGRARSAFQHYTQFGRARGYLPHLRAERGFNPSAPASPFGGLWIDQAHVRDLIDGKLETGFLSAAQAEQLKFFVGNGYVILPGAVPARAVAAARADLDRAYAGDIQGAQFESAKLGKGPLPWAPVVQQSPAKVLDLHYFSSACRKIMFSPKITAFLGLIFESKVFASQSLGFLRGSAQEGHQDSAYVVYTLARHFAASWIALEDVTIGAGELFYYPGSHRFPEFFYGAHYKSVSEARRMGTPESTLNEQIGAHVGSLDERARKLGLPKEVFVARAGDALIWHADLVHGGNPVSETVTRKSFVTHYCPRYAAPLFAELTRTPLMEHEGHFYTSSYYW
jgi:ectoine hydroxylase-related dioxygenase (phytanoyl-CoA dioxygenase family)